MATKKNTENAEVVDATVVQDGEKQQEMTFTVTETQANELLNRLSKLAWADANPIIIFIQQNFKPVESK